MADARSKERTVLGLAAGASFLALLDVTVVNIAFADLRRDFSDASLGDLSWVVSAYAVLFAALLTPAGRLADVVGRRRVFAAGAAGFTAMSALAAAAPGVEVLVAARALQGAFAALLIPSALGLVLTGTAPERRMAAVGVWGAAGSLAAAAGPALGGLLVDAVGWRSVFVINLPLGALLVLGALRRLPADAIERRPLPDAAGTVVVAASIGALVAGITKGEEWGWGATATVACLAAGALGLAFALRRSSRVTAPAVETALWRSRTFAVANLASLVLGAAVFAWLLLGPLFLTAAWDYTVLEAGLALTPGAFTAAAAAVVVGRRASPDVQRVAVAGDAAVMFATALWMRLVLGDDPQFLAQWLPASLISGAAIGAAFTGVATAAATSVPPARFATGAGMNLTARQFGGALGVAGLAALLAGHGVPETAAFLDVYSLVAAISAAAALVGLALMERPAAAGAPATAGAPR